MTVTDKADMTSAPSSAGKQAKLPWVSCICVTYKRPDFLPHAVESFLRQDYPRRELIVLDDAGQYPDGLSGAGWRIHATDKRYPSLGEKRNAACALASSETEYLAVWDDDDIYLPWHLSAAVRALEQGDLALPSSCWVFDHLGIHEKPTQGLFHSGWVYRKASFLAVGGYPSLNSGEDQAFAERLKKTGVRIVDPCRFAKPSLIYRWQIEVEHLSAMSSNGYAELANRPSHQIRSITPHWDREWELALPLTEKVRSS